MSTERRSTFSRFMSGEKSSAPISETPSQSPGVFWPEHFLAPDIPEAIVWTFGYNVDSLAGKNMNTVNDHSRDLVNRLERELDDNRPIVFIAHSLGGIVLKDAIKKSENVRLRTKMIIFLGTPHRGSGAAAWGQILSTLITIVGLKPNRQIFKTLGLDSEILNRIHADFMNLLAGNRIKIFSLQEGRVLGGINRKVVDNFSSKLDLPRDMETVESIDANHMQMARFGSKEDEGYRVIRDILR
ncbi:hypothetical protein B0J11DRAFT_601969, partial [Dendryphion nanum]